MRYRKRLDDNLLPAASKGKLRGAWQIYVRPPKTLKGPTQTFAWTVIEPGRFDLENSFIDQDKAESPAHLGPREANQGSRFDQEGSGTETEAVPRGDFTTDVIEV